MKMRKHTLALLLALILVVSLLPTAALAANTGTVGPLKYKISNGEAIITGCDSNVSGTVVIPSKINGCPVTGIEYAFQFCSNLKCVEIPSGVVRISNSAFWDCYNMESVVIPNTVREIGASAFWCCDSLKQASIPEGVTNINGLFYHCTKLQTVSLPSTLKSIGLCTFAGCDRLTDIYFAGSQAQWKAISVDTGPDEASSGSVPNGNIQLTRAKIHYGAAMPDTGFSDVSPTAYYAEPVQWAVKKNITQGTGNGCFSPDAACSRAQVVTFLWRAKNCPEPKGTGNPFKDVSSGAYYYKAVLWAVENGITQGVGAGRFAPNDTVTRGQVVTFLWRSQGGEKVGGANPFRDVKAGQYFTDAVLWAVNHNPQITNGTSKTEFSPANPCTRAQIVTFLYRSNG